MATTEQRLTSLEQRCTALATEIDKFKFIVKFLIGVAAALGISVPVVYAHLTGKYADLQKKYQSVQSSEQDAENGVKSLQAQLAALSGLETKIRLLDSKAETVERKIARAKETGTQVDSGRKLQEDILQFQSPPLAQADAWSGYRNDLEGLKALAVRYVGYVTGDPKQDSNHAINKDLPQEAVRSRVNLDSSTDSSYKWHVTETPTNFENLLKQFASDQDSGQLTNTHLAGCYKDAFPIWLDNVGVKGTPKVKTSDECKRLLRLSD
jgi:hypothetical protein